MVYIQDSTQSFTITLSALLEGVGNISVIEVTNVSTGLYGHWEGTWTSPIPATTEGDSIVVSVEVVNNGAVADTLFAEFISTQVTPSQALLQEMPNVAIGTAGSAEWTFTMPPNNVNITINAGHIAPA